MNYRRLGSRVVAPDDRTVIGTGGRESRDEAFPANPTVAGRTPGGPGARWWRALATHARRAIGSQVTAVSRPRGGCGEQEADRSGIHWLHWIAFSEVACLCTSLFQQNSATALSSNSRYGFPATPTIGGFIGFARPVGDDFRSGSRLSALAF